MPHFELKQQKTEIFVFLNFLTIIGYGHGEDTAGLGGVVAIVHHPGNPGYADRKQIPRLRPGLHPEIADLVHLIPKYFHEFKITGVELHDILWTDVCIAHDSDLRETKKQEKKKK